MLSKFPWNKRSSRNKSQHSIESYSSSSQQNSPELPTEKFSQSPPHRPGLLSRVRSQRFSTANLPSPSLLEEPIPSLNQNRHSYVQPWSQPLYDAEEIPRPQTTSSAPKSSSQKAAEATFSSPAPSIFTTTGNQRGENLSPVWTPGQLIPDAGSERPSPVSNIDIDSDIDSSERPSMSVNGANSLSSDSTHGQAQAQAQDRWTQRRLQRLNTEQGFREQRQASHSKSMSNSTQLQDPLHQQHQQQHSSTSNSNSNVNTNSNPNSSSSAPASASASVSASTPSSASPAYRHDTSQQPSYQSLPQSRSFTRPQDDGSFAVVTSQIKQPPSRQSIMPLSGQNQNPTVSQQQSHQHQQPQMSQQAPPQQQQQQQQQSQQPQQQAKDVGRSTPQPQQGDDLSTEDVSQLLKDHKELREKYTKVKKYYFEKEDQVKQLQNSLAHQRIAQSRTSLDDSEYATRFNRLDGLIAQLSFSIRKSWKSLPTWLTPAINKDAIAVGKQEMTAAGRAFISYWLVQDVFEKYFHPDLDMQLSTQLKAMQKNIRRFAPPPTVHEDEEYLTSKVVNWRLTTLEALQDTLRLPQAQTNRSQLTDLLKSQLLAALNTHLDNPPTSDLDGGVHMICELAVAMLGHLPQESRDVSIEYFVPGSVVNADIMKIESGIPALTSPLADEGFDHGSNKSPNSDTNEALDPSSADSSSRKRHMLSALTGNKKSHAVQGKHNGGSNTSLGRPAEVVKDEQRVRLAVGIAAHVRERNILVKAPVFTT